MHAEAHKGVPMDQETYERGMTMRRQVLGDAHVDAASAHVDDFTRD